MLAENSVRPLFNTCARPIPLFWKRYIGPVLAASICCLLASPALSSDTFFRHSEINAAFSPRADAECCSDPGSISNCWWYDADQDGITCKTDTDCRDGQTCDLSKRGPDGQGRCTCNKDADCDDGGTRSGICAVPDGQTEGLCGPSFCNGFSLCTCWGSCLKASPGGYTTPSAMCGDTSAGFPGYCCEGAYPSSPSGLVQGYCTMDDTCGKPVPECAEDIECDDLNPCTVDTCDSGQCATTPASNGTACQTPLADGLSIDCALTLCVDSVCVVSYMDENTPCLDNALAADPATSGDAACTLSACTAAGECTVRNAPSGTPCDDENPCSSLSSCNASGRCEGTVPDTASTVCCDPNAPADFDDGNPCTLDACPDTAGAAQYTSVHTALPDFTDCSDPSLRPNDECGVWQCKAGTCTEATAQYVGDACNLSSWSTCITHTCSAALGEEGECVTSPRNEGAQCEWNGAPDTCERKVCTDGACTYALPVGSTGCTVGTGTQNPCCETVCNLEHVCVESTCASPEEAAERCDGVDMGILPADIGSGWNTDGSNKCASDDYRVDGTGIFAECNTTDRGETVYRVTETTHLSEYQLRHTEISLSGDEGFDPVLYTSESCDDAAGSGKQPYQYTCNATSSSLSLGPWPLVDTPDSDMPSGILVSNTKTNYVFVDSRNNAVPAGGDYTLTAEVVPHDNSNCVNTADHVSAPRITGGSRWQERFLGNLTDYENYFYETGASLDTYCWDGGTATADDPKFAFFRLDLPDGETNLSRGTLPWDQTYKVYVDPNGSGLVPNVLSWWGGNSPDGDCTDALESMQACRNPPMLAPREMVVARGDTLRSGFTAVSNAAPGASFDYALNVLRVPRPFLGMSQQFVGPGEGTGCSCDVNNDWAKEFSIVGSRLDFVPTNDDVGGFAVLKTASSTPSRWLVNGGTMVCEGAGCVSPSITQPFDIGFQFPYSGDVWSKFCIDAAGAITLAKTSTDCVNTWDMKPNTTEYLESRAPRIAPLWGSIVPCNRFTKDTCKWTGFWQSGGDLKCDHPAWPCWLGCDVWEWGRTSCTQNGAVYKQMAAFEGTSALVVTWSGFDGNFNPRNGGSGYTLDFQAILRVDGRITFFYKTPPEGADEWVKILDVNGWLVGLSGGRSLECNSDDECNTAFNTTGLMCDNSDYTVEGNLIWEAKDRCMNPVNFQQTGTVQVSGKWIGQ